MEHSRSAVQEQPNRSTVMAEAIRRAERRRDAERRPDSDPTGPGHCTAP
jgi:hypothetical protein